MLFAQDSGIRLFHLPGLVYDFHLMFFQTGHFTSVRSNEGGRRGLVYDFHLMFLSDCNHFTSVRSYNEGGGGGRRGATGGGRPMTFDFHLFIYFISYLFIFIFCLSAQRLVMSIMVIPHSIMIVFWKKNLKTGKKCVGLHYLQFLSA